MNPSELLRLVDTLHREKDIGQESVFQGIEAALLSAARKHLGASEELQVTIDRETGEISALDGDREIDPSALGRIAAQTAKQVMIQKIREAERDSISQDFSDRIHTVVAGTVQRFEGPNIIVGLHRTEGFLPRSEQLFNEVYHVGERLRALVLEVRTIGTRVRVVLSRTHPDFIRRLFELEVPEVSEGQVEVTAIAREAGHRTKIAVSSLDPRVDCVGACVGIQGSRIKSIVDELNGEKIDIVRWSDQIDVLIANTLKPAEIASIELDEEALRALVIVPDDQLSLAIGKRGQNVRLASKLTGWEIDMKSDKKPAPAEPEPSEAVGPEVLSESVEEGEKPKADVEAEPDTEVEVETEPDTEIEVETEPDTEIDVETEPGTKAELETAPDTRGVEEMSSDEDPSGPRASPSKDE